MEGAPKPWNLRLGWSISAGRDYRNVAHKWDNQGGTFNSQWAVPRINPTLSNLRSSRSMTFDMTWQRDWDARTPSSTNQTQTSAKSGRPHQSRSSWPIPLHTGYPKRIFCAAGLPQVKSEPQNSNILTTIRGHLLCPTLGMLSHCLLYTYSTYCTHATYPILFLIPIVLVVVSLFCLTWLIYSCYPWLTLHPDSSSPIMVYVHMHVVYRCKMVIEDNHLGIRLDSWVQHLLVILKTCSNNYTSSPIWKRKKQKVLPV
jgi:hypothetical protein